MMSQKQTSSDFLKQIIGRPVVVRLNNGVGYRGKQLSLACKPAEKSSIHWPLARPCAHRASAATQPSKLSRGWATATQRSASWATPQRLSRGWAPPLSLTMPRPCGRQPPRPKSSVKGRGWATPHSSISHGLLTSPLTSALDWYHDSTLRESPKNAPQSPLWPR